MGWENITIAQFQDIHRLSLNTDLSEEEQSTRIVALLNNMTEKEVGELSMPEYARLKSECAFIFDKTIPGKAEKYIKTENTYGIIYDPKKLKHRQYVEILHFSKKPIDNMHLIMASLVQPVEIIKKGLFKRKCEVWKDNQTKDHEAIANDLLNARVIDVYHSCVFFCKLYSNSIEAIKDYLVRQMTTQGMTKEQAENIVLTSRQAMPGFTTPQKWQS